MELVINIGPIGPLDEQRLENFSKKENDVPQTGQSFGQPFQGQFAYFVETARVCQLESASSVAGVWLKTSLSWSTVT